MTRLTGLPVEALDVLGDVAEDLVERLLGEVAAEVARGWTVRSTADDLSRVTDLWRERVDDELTRMLGGALRAGTDAVAPVLVPDNDPAALSAGVTNLSQCALRATVRDPRVTISQNVASTMANGSYPLPPPISPSDYQSYWRWFDEVDHTTIRNRNEFWQPFYREDLVRQSDAYYVRSQIHTFIERYTGSYENVPRLRREMDAGDWTWVREAVAHGPRYDGVLHRTVAFDPYGPATGIDLDRIAPGTIIDHRHLSSYTRFHYHPGNVEDNAYAIKYSPNLFIHLHGASGLPVEKISNTPHELEWLVGGHARVRTVKRVPRLYGGEIIHDLEVIADYVPAHLTAAAEPYVFPLPDKIGPMIVAPPRPPELPPPDPPDLVPLPHDEVEGPALTAATFNAGAVYRVPCVDNAFAEAYLGARRNHLARVGDELWEDMRDELLEGYRRGESVDQLADRLRRAHRLTAARARTIARTEVIGAADVGSLLQVRATGLPALKRWIATNDSRTRPHHRAAHGQEVALDDKFRVGGSFLDGPHDPLGPASEVVQCRCALGYEVDLTGVEPSGLTVGEIDIEVPSFTRRWAEELYLEGLEHEAFIVAEHVAAAHEVEATATISSTGLTAAADEAVRGGGAMVALVPDDVEDLALDEDADGREPPEVLHLTLLFLGEEADYDDDDRRHLIDAVRNLAAKRKTQLGRVFGAAHWNTDTDSPSWNLQVGGPGLENLRDEVLDVTVRGVLGPGRLPEQHSPWVPHVCLAYTGEDLYDEVAEKVGRDLRFSVLRVAFGDHVEDLPLGTRDEAGGRTVAPSGTLLGKVGAAT